MKRILLLFLVLTFTVFPKNAFASEEFINLVHPVRISTYNKNPLESIKAEYEEIKKRNLPSTWLFTYDVLKNSDVVKFTKAFDKNQELALFFEVTPNLAKKADVEYNSSDSWHRAKSLFLIGYKQQDRIKLIDTLFSEFKGRFSFYPKSVGAWWIDSFSLSYMFEKYGIISNLTVADQFSTDNYSIWGQYWSYPFYPSKIHAGIPGSEKNKIGVVTIQWAPRDPLNAFGDSVASKYSAQDYLTLSLKDDYLKSLIEIYALKGKNLFGQMIFGLESDLSPDTYPDTYSKQLDTLISLAKEKKIEFVTMEKFGEWFRKKFPQDTPSSLLGGNDLLGTKLQSYWFQTARYRLGFVFDPEKKEIEIVDLRVYQENFQEPFFNDIITENDLRINIPSVIDKVSDPNTVVTFNNIDSLKISRNEKETVLILSSNKKIILKDTSIIFENFPKKDLLRFINNPYTSENIGKSTEIKINKDFPIDPEGFKFNNLSVETIYFLLRPKIKLITPFLLIAFISLFSVLLYLISKKSFNRLYLIFLTIIFIGSSFIGYLSLNKVSNKYLISQGEFDALIHLKVKPRGLVLIEDSKCLVCATNNEKKNPSYGNIRDYVGIISGKKPQYEENLFKIVDHKQAGLYFDKLNTKYIYITKNKGFENKLKLSPGDYGIRKIYENSNSQVWESVN